MKASALLLSISAVTVCILFGISSRRYFSSNQNKLQETSSNQQTISRVTALGRLEPQGDIIHLSAPASNQRLAELRVQEGDRVKAGQIIAIMDNFNQYQAAVENAKAKVIVARSRLAQVQAGEKFGQIEAQRKKVAEMKAQLFEGVKVQETIIARQQVELLKAENDYQQYKTLSQQGAVSAADTETKRLQVEIEKKKLQEAIANLSEQVSTGSERVKESQATLQSVKYVKPTDILVAKAELNESLSQLRKAKVDMESTYVQAPVAGQILSVNAKVGEVIGSGGIVDIGQTQQMYVMAEVYESDIQYIKVNQPAIIISEYGGFTGEIKGIVDRIGLQIDKPGIVNDDPSARADVRIVKVKIRLHPNDSERVRTLNKLQVRASIQIR
ncbi:HlyD family efflux transporter periplasmic adaptor subunit [Nostoc sp. C117]|uniref:HlyD family efflux transporter periplasmic adaptor subunit n=1 Tax=Nostoc sp. C117 TaxID=3349875 RepID=UPI00370D45F9